MIWLQLVAGEADKIGDLSFDGLALHDRLEQLRAKRRVPDRIEQNRSAGVREMRDDRVRGALGNRVRGFVGSDLHRNGIRFRRSIQIVYLNEQKSRAVTVRGNGKLLNHLEIAKGPRLGAKPAGVADVIGQDFALELFSLAITKENVQIGRRLDRWHNVFLRRTASVGRRLQREPIIGMRAERDDVARVPDRPKQIAAKNVHVHVAGEPRYIQLSELPEA